MKESPEKPPDDLVTPAQLLKGAEHVDQRVGHLQNEYKLKSSELLLLLRWSPMQPLELHTQVLVYYVDS